MPGISTSLTPSEIGAANVAGLASGINFNDVVGKLMAVEKQKVSLLEGRQSAETNKQDALATLNTNLAALRTQAQGLANSGDFFVNASTLASNTATDPATLLKITPSSTAATGTHTVIVGALASAEKFVSTAAVVDANTGAAVTGTMKALGLTGSFTITGQASAAQTVSVSATDSLQDIVNSINLLNTGANATKVTANILTVSSTSGSEDFRLVITADNTGASKGTTGLASVSSSLTATGALADLNIDPLLTATKTATAVDASLTVDGVSGITRDKNSITDVIPGFTLDLLKKDTATTITITTTVDQAAVKAKVQAFVDAYNTAMTFINDQMKFDSKTQTSGLLSSDATVRSIQSQLSSKILASVPGLKSDRNSLVLAGVAPDDKGKLVIDDAKLSSLLSTSPTAVRDVFAATGSGSVASLSFLVAGLDTVSGTYAANITTAAAKAGVLGTTDLSSGIGSTTTDTVTITDSAGRQATLTLDGGGAGVNATGSVDGSSLSAIVSSLNTEFATVRTEKRQMGTAMVTGTTGGAAATSATLFQDLTDGTNSLSVAANDTITITGTKRSGGSVSATFTVLDPATDTLGDLLSTIQVAFDQQATATIDSNGKITLTDNASGDSSLSFTLTSGNGALDARLGADTLVTEGRFAMQLSAAASGTALKIQANTFGSGPNFTMSQGTDSLGFGNLAIDTGATGQPATVTKGVDVAGTIGGLAATGTGQTLTGSAGNANGLAILYTGSSTGAVGDMTVKLGIGAVYDGLLDTFTNPASGLILNDITASRSVFDKLQTQIDAQNARIDQERARLIKQFQQMESIISNLNATGQFLSQQLNQTSKK